MNKEEVLQFIDNVFNGMRVFTANALKIYGPSILSELHSEKHKQSIMNNELPDEYVAVRKYLEEHLVDNLECAVCGTYLLIKCEKCNRNICSEDMHYDPQTPDWKQSCYPKCTGEKK